MNVMDGCIKFSNFVFVGAMFFLSIEITFLV